MHQTEVVIPYYYTNLFFDPSRDVQALRKAMVGELFIIFMAYFANLVRNHFLNPMPSQPSGAPAGRNDDGKNRIQGMQRLSFLSNLPYLEERFAIYFMHHTVALAFSLIWAPYEFEIAITYIHLGLFFGYIMGEMKEIHMLQTICYGFMVIINLLLILAGIVNIGNYKV